MRASCQFLALFSLIQVLARNRKIEASARSMNCRLLTVLLVAVAASQSGAHAEQSAEQKCSTTLTQVAEIPTEGNSGFEVYRDGEDSVRLLSACLWDGASPDWIANSYMYNVSAAADGAVEVLKMQRFETRGATHMKYVEYGNEMNHARMLMVTNHLRCGSKDQALKNQGCAGVSIFAPNGVGWTDFKALKTYGPTRVEQFVVGGNLYLVIPEQFKNEISIWKFDQDRAVFEVVFRLKNVNTPTDAHPIIIDDKLYVVAAAKYGKQDWGDIPGMGRVAGPQTEEGSTVVFSLENGTFTQNQAFRTMGTADVDFMATVDGNVFMFVAEERNSSQATEITSHIMVWDRELKQFAVFQEIPTDGARHGKFFMKGNDIWLAVSNYGDMKKGRVEAKSKVYKFVFESQKFEEQAEIDTFGATGIQAFTLGSHQYLAVANQGHITAKKYQTSYIYRLDEKCTAPPSLDKVEL